MPSTRFVGTQIQLTIAAKFPTFTPDQFSQALKDKGFTLAQAQAVNPQSGQASIVQMFSKGNVSIFLLPSGPSLPPQIVFQILNTVDLNDASGGASVNSVINEMLGRLNIAPQVVASINFNCRTMVTTTKKPSQVLTSCLKQEKLAAISKAMSTNLVVQTLNLATAFPIEKRGVQIIIEPLLSNPESQYFVNIIFQTDSQSEYSDFISRFGEKQIEEIEEAIASNV